MLTFTQEHLRVKHTLFVNIVSKLALAVSFLPWRNFTPPHQIVIHPLTHVFRESHHFKYRSRVSKCKRKSLSSLLLSMHKIRYDTCSGYSFRDIRAKIRTPFERFDSLGPLYFLNQEQWKVCLRRLFQFSSDDATISKPVQFAEITLRSRNVWMKTGTQPSLFPRNENFRIIDITIYESFAANHSRRSSMPLVTIGYVCFVNDKIMKKKFNLFCGRIFSFFCSSPRIIHKIINFVWKQTYLKFFLNSIKFAIIKVLDMF